MFAFNNSASLFKFFEVSASEVIIEDFESYAWFDCYDNPYTIGDFTYSFMDNNEIVSEAYTFISVYDYVGDSPKSLALESDFNQISIKRVDGKEFKLNSFKILGLDYNYIIKGYKDGVRVSEATQNFNIDPRFILTIELLGAQWANIDEYRISNNGDLRGIAMYIDDINYEINPVVDSVTISPDNVTVKKNSTQQFTHTVNGDYLTYQNVTWSISGNSSEDTVIDGNGLLIVAGDETATEIIVKATSVQNHEKSSTVSVIISDAFTVKFVNYNGAVLSEQFITKGGSAIAPVDPTRPTTAKYRYTFSGWDTDFSNVNSDLTVKAIFSPIIRKYYATFVDYDGTIIDKQIITYGKSATAPTGLTRSSSDGYSYVFTGWDVKFNSITENTVITAMYDKYKPGDTDGDGAVTIADLINMKKMGLSSTTQSYACDFNNDRVFNVFDIIMLKRACL